MTIRETVKLTIKETMNMTISDDDDEDDDKKGLIHKKNLQQNSLASMRAKKFLLSPK